MTSPSTTPPQPPTSPPKPPSPTPSQTLTESLISIITLLFNTPIIPPDTTPPELQLTDIPPSAVLRQESRRSTSSVDSAFTIGSSHSPTRPGTIPKEHEGAGPAPSRSPQNRMQTRASQGPPRVELRHGSSASANRALTGLGVLEAITID